MMTAAIASVRTTTRPADLTRRIVSAFAAALADLQFSGDPRFNPDSTPLRLGVRINVGDKRIGITIEIPSDLAADLNPEILADLISFESGKAD